MALLKSLESCHSIMDEFAEERGLDCSSCTPTTRRKN